MEKEAGAEGIEQHGNLYGNSRGWEAVAVYVRSLHTLFYKKIWVEGKENIPDGCPVIFAPNHQNALMDPLAVLFSSGKQVVFLARADIFKQKILARFFYFLKILPVFRIRDGKEKLQNNDETFNIAIKVLESKQSVGLFPEARHNNKRSLLPLKKGLPRVAFMAEEQNDFRLKLKILPVGINYSNYQKMRSVLRIRFGEAFSLQDYQEEYLENPQKAMISLRDEMAKRIKPLIIDIADNEMYDTVDSISRLAADEEKDFSKKFQIQKSAIAKFESLQAGQPAKAKILKEKTTKFECLKKKYKLSNKIFGFSKPLCFNVLANSLWLVLLLPVFLYGLLNNAIAYFAPRLFVPKIKDRQFHSSVKFGWAVFVIPVIYFIQTVVFAVFFPKILWILLYALSLPVFGYLAKIISEWASTTFEKWRVLGNKTVFFELEKLKAEILEGICH